MDIDFKSEQQFELADDLIKENDLQGAIDTLHNILYDNPNFGKAHNHLGWIYETKYKKYDKAEEHYQLAMKLSPDYPAAYVNYIYFLYAVGKYGEIEEHLLKAEKVPGVSRATLANEWGILFESQQKFDEAIYKYKEYIALSFDDNAIQTAETSIKRCQKKKEIFNNI